MKRIFKGKGLIGAINIDGTDLTGAELVVLDAVTAGTVTASKAVVVDSNKDIGDFRNLDVTNLDAGLSGTAGTVDVFPTTASKGKIAITAADSTGNTTTTIVNASQAAARIYTIPDGGTDASFLLTQGAQTVVGVNSFTSPIVHDHNTAITAFATGGQASATALTGEYNNVTVCATAGDSVKLLTAVVGQVQTVKNSGATAVDVFPNTSDSINALAINLAVRIEPSSSMTFQAIDGTVWETEEVLTLPAPTTAKGSFVAKATDNTGNTSVTLTNAAHGQATIVTIPDVGLATSYVVQSTAALTAAEANVLDGATAGTQVASKAVVADANVNIGVVKATALHIGSTGAEVQVTADVPSLNALIKLSQTVGFAAFTDGGAAIGTFDLTGQIPIGATYLSSAITAVTGFAGDTSAVLTIGDGSDADRYNTGTPNVFATAANGIEVGIPSGVRYHDTAATVKLTITTATDWTIVSAGSLTIERFYIT